MDRHEGEEHLALKAAFRALLAGVKTGLQHIPMETGVCCCGSEMNGHSVYDGHQPRDEGEYFITKLIMDAEEALSDIST
jgi:hypothetical protein